MHDDNYKLEDKSYKKDVYDSEKIVTIVDESVIKKVAEEKPKKVEVKKINKITPIVKKEEKPILSRTLTYTPLGKISGSDIEGLQRLLISKNYNSVIKVNGVYGSDTKMAVMVFQKDNGLKMTGIVDKETWEMLGGIWEGDK